MFDSHAHYDDRRFDEDREAVLAGLPKPCAEDPVGVSGVLCCGSDRKSSLSCIALAARFDFIYAAGGIHPHEAKSFCPEDLYAIKAWYQGGQICAIGEIGLDYHYDFSPRARQQEVFSAQLALARQLDAPVIIHDREAHADTLSLLRASGVKRGVMHSYSGSKESIADYLSLGFYISFSGSVTFRNAQKTAAAARAVPDERLLVETDAPYLAPEPYRGRRCDSHLMYATAQKLAQLREVGVEKILRQTEENAKRLFSL